MVRPLLVVRVVLAVLGCLVARPCLGGLGCRPLLGLLGFPVVRVGRVVPVGMACMAEAWLARKERSAAFLAFPEFLGLQAFLGDQACRVVPEVRAGLEGSSRRRKGSGQG